MSFWSPQRLLRRSLHYSAVVSRWRFRPLLVHKRAEDPEMAEPDYFERQAENTPLGPNYVATLEKLYETKFNTSRDIIYRKDDHLIRHDSRYWLPEVDEQQCKLSYLDVKELEDAPESVKKMFSVSYGTRKDLTEAWKKHFMDLVRKNRLDDSSLESKIAHSTVQIRHLTELWETTVRYRAEMNKVKANRVRPPRMRVSIQLLKRLVSTELGRRRQLMRLLRDTDVDKFEKVLQELKIAYHVPPLPEDRKADTRKGWIQEQVRRRAESEKEAKLEAYRLQLEEESKTFFAEKEAKLAQLAAEERQLLDDIAQMDGTLDAQPHHHYLGHTIDEVSEEMMFKDYRRIADREHAIASA